MTDDLNPDAPNDGTDEIPAAMSWQMSEEQLAYFDERTDRTVARRLRSYRISATIGFVVLLIGILVAITTTSQNAANSREAVVKSGKAVAVEGCNRDFERDLKFRNLLNRLKASTLANPATTPEQKKAGVLFYDGELKKFALPDCRRSEALLTDNPEQDLPSIDPYYPGGPNVGVRKRLPQDKG